MAEESIRENQLNGDFEFIPISKQKANQIASNFKLFGWEPLSGEQIEKFRTPARAIATEFGSRALGSAADITKLAANLAGIPEKITKHFPSSDRFQKFLAEQTGEPFPEDLGQFGNYLKDIAGKAGAIGGLGGAGSAAATFGIPVASGTVKHTLKAANAPEWLQTGLEMITDLSLGFRGSQSARDRARAFHREASDLIPDSAVIDGRAMRNEMQNLVTSLERGGADPVKNPVLGKAREVINVIDQNGGMLPVNEAFAFRTSVNNIMGDPTTLEGSRRLLPRINRLMNEAMEAYGTNQNPEFLAFLREGDDIVQGLANSERAAQFLRNKAPKDLRSPLSYLAFALNPATYIGFFGGAKLAQFGHQIWNSPALRRHYLDTVRNALAGNGKAAITDLRAFDKEAAKQFPELEEGDFEYIPSK